MKPVLDILKNKIENTGAECIKYAADTVTGINMKAVKAAENFLADKSVPDDAEYEKFLNFEEGKYYCLKVNEGNHVTFYYFKWTDKCWITGHNMWVAYSYGSKDCGFIIWDVLKNINLLGIPLSGLELAEIPAETYKANIDYIKAALKRINI